MYDQNFAGLAANDKPLYSLRDIVLVMRTSYEFDAACVDAEFAEFTFLCCVRWHERSLYNVATG